MVLINTTEGNAQHAPFYVCVTILMSTFGLMGRRCLCV